MIKGMRRHLNRLINGQKISADITRKLYVIGQQIEISAERSITRGAASGKRHVASAPGEAPNNDTSHLRNNIETKIVSTKRDPAVDVQSNAEYSAALEFGTEKMLPRPFMKPAADKFRDKVPEGIVASVNTALRG